MEQKITYKANKNALENGITATLSIQFVEEPNGRMSVLSASVIKGYDNTDYALCLETALRYVIQGLLGQ